MHFLQDFSLKRFNTFGIDVSCKLFTEANSKEDIYSLIDSRILTNEKYFILGGGSNILFTDNFDGLIIKTNNQFIEIAGSDNDFVWIKAGAGVVWDELVEFALANNLSGLENLIGIPGTVGASAYQNIGAYGVEAKDSIEEVEVINLSTGKNYSLKNGDCNFEYRNSIFKQNKSKSEIINSVTYRLSVRPIINTSYGNIQEELTQKRIKEPSIHNIADIIKDIRNKKLPNPKVLGSGGSYFKNPVVSNEKYDVLKKSFPNIVAYSHTENTFKISAGWLIDQCGWKGKSIGQAGVFEKQALVLVNLGNATGKEIVHLAEEIQKSVKKQYDIDLEPEVIIL